MYVAKKIVVNNKAMTVITEEELRRMYDQDMIMEDTCIEKGDYVYPVSVTYRPDVPSATINEAAIFYTEPKTEEEKKEYASSKIIDFSSTNIKSFQDHIKMVDAMKTEQSIGLSTINNALTLPANDYDTPELRIIKEAINAKKIDADAYKDKFPSNSDFNNDMRALKNTSNNTISFFKAKRILKSFDIEAELIIRDQEGAINPIGKEFRIILTEED